MSMTITFSKAKRIRDVLLQSPGQPPSVLKNWGRPAQSPPAGTAGQYCLRSDAVITPRLTERQVDDDVVRAEVARDVALVVDEERGGCALSIEETSAL